ncbi:transposase [Patescibacteria group bacterium]|nr:transposase [Patescibacteria group bacterium]
MEETLIRWQEYILNYFNNFSTNAYAQGCHKKVKMIKRMSFGFLNIENYIAKVMLAFAPLLYFSHHAF